MPFEGNPNPRPREQPNSVITTTLQAGLGSPPLSCAFILT